MTASVTCIRTRKTIIQFPTFQMLAGDYDFPLWFVREGMEQLRANEPYAHCAGIGYVYRYYRWVTTHVNPELTQARFEAHILEYPKRYPEKFWDVVVQAYAYQTEDFIQGLDALMVPALRRREKHHEQLRNLKRIRDDMESVKQLLFLLDINVDTGMVDNRACFIQPYLKDDHRYFTIIEPRLNTLYEHAPHCWWAVKGTF